MKKTLLFLSLLASILLFNHTLSSQCIGGYLPSGQRCGGTVQTAVPFLRITPDARSGAMGDVGIALTPDANSILYNASKLALADKKWGVSVNYSPWLRNTRLKDLFLLHGAAYYQFGNKVKQAVAISYQYFDYGKITWTDFNGDPIREGHPFEMALTGAYSRQLSDKWSLGLSGKYIYSELPTNISNIDFHAGKAFAVDISTTYKKPLALGKINTNLIIGATVSNVGNKVSYTDNSRNGDFLPANLGIAGAWEVEFNANHKMLISLEFNKSLVVTPQPNDTTGTWKDVSVVKGIFKSFSDAPNGFKEEMQEITTSMGIEYWLFQRVALRGGYFHENELKGGRKFYTLGGGLRYKMYGFNISYLKSMQNLDPLRRYLDNTWRFSLLLNGFTSKVAL